MGASVVQLGQQTDRQIKAELKDPAPIRFAIDGLEYKVTPANMGSTSAIATYSNIWITSYTDGTCGNAFKKKLAPVNIEITGGLYGNKPKAAKGFLDEDGMLYIEKVDQSMPLKNGLKTMELDGREYVSGYMVDKYKPVASFRLLGQAPDPEVKTAISEADSYYSDRVTIGTRNAVKAETARLNKEGSAEPVGDTRPQKPSYLERLMEWWYRAKGNVQRNNNGSLGGVE